MKYSHLILLQETWLFECNLYLLGEINSNLCFAAKGADHYNPLTPSQAPRGYGGVAILWKNNISTIFAKITLKINICPII